MTELTVRDDMPLPEPITFTRDPALTPIEQVRAIWAGLSDEQKESYADLAQFEECVLPMFVGGAA